MAQKKASKEQPSPYRQKTVQPTPETPSRASQTPQGGGPPREPVDG